MLFDFPGEEALQGDVDSYVRAFNKPELLLWLPHLHISSVGTEAARSKTHWRGSEKRSWALNNSTAHPRCLSLSLSRKQLDDVNLVLVLFDVTRSQTFENCVSWLNKARSKAGSSFMGGKHGPCVLICL